LGFGPKGATLAVMLYDGAVRRWDLPRGLEHAARRGHQCCVWGALSPDASAAAWPGLDQKVQVWNLAEGTLRAVLPVSACRCWAWAPDGQALAVGLGPGGHDISVCDSQTGAVQLELGNFPPPAACLAFSPDGHRLAVGAIDGTIDVWDRSTRERVWSCQGH